HKRPAFPDRTFYEEIRVRPFGRLAHKRPMNVKNPTDVGNHKRSAHASTHQRINFGCNIGENLAHCFSDTRNLCESIPQIRTDLLFEAHVNSSHSLLGIQTYCVTTICLGVTALALLDARRSS